MTTRGTKAGQTFLDLRKKAKAEGRNTDELLQLHALEAFLDRLIASPHGSSFSLKGGVLLLAYGVRRPTRDVDLSTSTLPNAIPMVRVVIDEISAVPRDDGWVLAVVDAETIREEDAYSGVRVTLDGALDRARSRFHVDVSFGDPISPPTQLVSIRRLLGGTLEVPGYPLAMIVAEKMVTALERGTASTRWRDFADIFLLSRMHSIEADVLAESLRQVAAARGAILRALAATLAGYPALAQTKWAAWVRKQGLGERLPDRFEVVLEAVCAFGDPVLEGLAAGHSWDTQDASWRPMPKTV